VNAAATCCVMQGWRRLFFPRSCGSKHMLCIHESFVAPLCVVNIPAFSKPWLRVRRSSKIQKTLHTFSANSVAADGGQQVVANNQLSYIIRARQLTTLLVSTPRPCRQHSSFQTTSFQTVPSHKSDTTGALTTLFSKLTTIWVTSQINDVVALSQLCTKVCCVCAVHHTAHHTTVAASDLCCFTSHEPFDRGQRREIRRPRCTGRF